MVVIQEDELAGQCLSRPVVTVGTFDGVHLGHRRVISEVVSRARERRDASVVVTFRPHPQAVLGSGAPPPVLTTTKEKLDQFEALGVQYVVLLRFTREFSLLSPEQFVRQILVEQIGMRELVTGYDHGFGHGRSGSPELLRGLARQEGFGLVVVPPLRERSGTVSSTRIRKLIEEGRLDSAAVLLGRPYSLAGKVVEGEARGRELDHPTANICVDHESEAKLLPPDGVYAAFARLGGQKLQAVMNIGTRPTFADSRLNPPADPPRSVEVHLLDFSGDIYRMWLKVEVIRRLRGEIAFPQPDALRNQIITDSKRARRVLGSVSERLGWSQGDPPNPLTSQAASPGGV